MSAQPPKDFRNPLAPATRPPGFVREQPKAPNGNEQLPGAPEFTAMEWGTVYNWLAAMTFSGTSDQLRQVLGVHESVMGKLKAYLEQMGLIPPGA
jgi:hypothetical protein